MAHVDVFLETPTGTINVNDLTAPLPPRHYYEAWRLNGTVIELDRFTTEEIASLLIQTAMNARIVDGITWQLNGADTPHPVRITLNMRLFLDNTQAAINHIVFPRPDVHSGKLFQDGVDFDIDDNGIVELALFAYSWGLKISQRSQGLIADLSNKTDQELEDYDFEIIDWTVTWNPSDQNNGWSNHTVTQTP